MNEWFWENRIFIHKNEIGPLSHIIHKYQLKMDCRLRLRPEIINFLGENIGEKFHGTGLGNDFVDMTLKKKSTNKTKQKINK